VVVVVGGARARWGEDLGPLDKTGRAGLGFDERRARGALIL
jgi:hypothetical protein